jgi:uncharacterized membrane protein YhaH (DUF805 family)
MTFQDSVRKCFTDYAKFAGRAARPELFWFFLFLIAANFVLGLIDSIIFPGDTRVFAPLFSVATFIPALAVAARRLHDIGKSAWWLLIGLIPVIGFLVLLYFYIQRGEEGANEYGPPPPR